jgi:hypothetical protein
MNTETARALMRALLDGTIGREEGGLLAAAMARGDEGPMDALSELDPDEARLLVRLLWVDRGGHDSASHPFDDARALLAADTGFDQLHAGRSDNVVALPFRRARIIGWALAATAAAAAVAVMIQPRPQAPSPTDAPVVDPVREDLQARGAQAARLDVSIDLSEWSADAPGAGRPLLTGDQVGPDTRVGVEWTNPDGAFTHLTLAREGADGGWQILERRAISRVAPDADGPVAGPFPAGRLCAVFSRAELAENDAVRALSDDSGAASEDLRRLCSRIRIANPE